MGWGGISINWNTVDHIEKVHEAKTNAEIMMMYGFGLNKASIGRYLQFSPNNTCKN